MTEEEYRISLGAYLLGALDPAETKALERHLLICAHCQREYLELSETLGALATIPPDLAAAGLSGTPPDQLAPRRAARDAGVGPAAPGGPAALTGPAAPIGPTAPGGPTALTGPTGQAAPPGPTAPVAPAAPGGPLAPTGHAWPVGPIEPARPPRHPAVSRRHGQLRALTAAAVAAAAVLVGALLGGYLLADRRTGSDVLAGQHTGGNPTPTADRLVTGTNQATGVSAVVALFRHDGGTYLDARVSGDLQRGWRCQLFVIPRAGAPMQAGSLTVTHPGRTMPIDATVAIPVEDIAWIQIRRGDEIILVSLAV